MTFCRFILIFIFLAPSLAIASSSMEWVSINSDSLKGSRGVGSNDGYVLFKGNVVAEGKMLLCADELKVTYGKNKIVKDVSATGLVKVFQGNKKASGDKATYNKTDGTITITGNPVLSECQGDISGDTIVFKIDGSAATIDSGVDTTDGRATVVLTGDKECDQTPYIKRVENASDLCK